ncbi:MAG: hypothetical protein P1V51_22990 [Deltaproteobacteria bacterium]|nr:hypothetical protein [Deltaproteobacteria bacterium]
MALCLACGEKGWPARPADYEFVSPTYIDEILAPRRDGLHYECCRDFGESSRDFIEDGEVGVDNAVTALFDGLAIFIGLNFQDQIDANIESGNLALVLDHAFYEKQEEPFTLVAHQVDFAEGTTWQSAHQGGGHFRVREESFMPGSGVPWGRFSEAVIDAGGTLRGSGGSLVWGLSVLGVPFRARIRDVRVEAKRQEDGEGWVRYTEGTLSGFLTLDDFYEGLNNEIARGCDCLGLTEPVYYKNVDGIWDTRCVSEAHTRCTRPEEKRCGDLTTTGANGPWLCEIILDVIQDAADLDLDGDPSRYEAASLGLFWSSVPAVMD